MFPEEVSYTGVDIDPRQIFRQRKGFIPAHWTRHQFTVEQSYVEINAIGKWIEERLNGRWAAHSFVTTEGAVVIIGFEEANDAIMFRLLDGEKSAKNNEIF